MAMPTKIHISHLVMGVKNSFSRSILNDGSILTIQNCIIKHNTADSSGGIFNNNEGALKLISGTIYDNNALDTPGWKAALVIGAH